MSRERARISILSEMLAFPTIHGKDWDCGIFGDHAEVGDLVSLSSAPETKWYLSWVRDIEAYPTGDKRYLLESVEDGTLCWWSNVGLNVYSRERVKDRPAWKWDDKQFAFRDRWHRVCYKQHDAYIVLPTGPTFGDDFTVSLGVRIRFAISDFTHTHEFPNWKKLTMKQMSAFYLECCELYHAAEAA